MTNDATIGSAVMRLHGALSGLDPALRVDLMMLLNEIGYLRSMMVRVIEADALEFPEDTVMAIQAIAEIYRGRSDPKSVR